MFLTKKRKVYNTFSLGRNSTGDILVGKRVQEGKLKHFFCAQPMLETRRYLSYHVAFYLDPFAAHSLSSGRTCLVFGCP